MDLSEIRDFSRRAGSAADAFRSLDEFGVAGQLRREAERHAMIDPTGLRAIALGMSSAAEVAEAHFRATDLAYHAREALQQAWMTDPAYQARKALDWMRVTDPAGQLRTTTEILFAAQQAAFRFREMGPDNVISSISRFHTLDLHGFDHLVGQLPTMDAMAPADLFGAIRSVVDQQQAFRRAIADIGPIRQPQSDRLFNVHEAIAGRLELLEEAVVRLADEAREARAGQQEADRRQRKSNSLQFHMTTAGLLLGAASLIVTIAPPKDEPVAAPRSRIEPQLNTPEIDLRGQLWRVTKTTSVMDNPSGAFLGVIFRGQDVTIREMSAPWACVAWVDFLSGKERTGWVQRAHVELVPSSNMPEAD